MVSTRDVSLRSPRHALGDDVLARATRACAWCGCVAAGRSCGSGDGSAPAARLRTDSPGRIRRCCCSACPSLHTSLCSTPPARSSRYRRDRPVRASCSGGAASVSAGSKPSAGTLTVRDRRRAGRSRRWWPRTARPRAGMRRRSRTRPRRRSRPSGRPSKQTHSSAPNSEAVRVGVAETGTDVGAPTDPSSPPQIQITDAAWQFRTVAGLFTRTAAGQRDAFGLTTRRRSSPDHNPQPRRTVQDRHRRNRWGSRSCSLHRRRGPGKSRCNPHRPRMRRDSSTDINRQRRRQTGSPYRCCRFRMVPRNQRRSSRQSRRTRIVGKHSCRESMLVQSMSLLQAMPSQRVAHSSGPESVSNVLRPTGHSTQSADVVHVEPRTPFCCAVTLPQPCGFRRFPRFFAPTWPRLLAISGPRGQKTGDERDEGLATQVECRGA